MAAFPFTARSGTKSPEHKGLAEVTWSVCHTSVPSPILWPMGMVFSCFPTGFCDEKRSKIFWQAPIQFQQSGALGITNAAFGSDRGCSYRQGWRLCSGLETRLDTSDPCFPHFAPLWGEVCPWSDLQWHSVRVLRTCQVHRRTDRRWWVGEFTFVLSKKRLQELCN